MKIQKPRAIDIIQNFTLLSDLSYSQNIVFNYAKITLDKAITISRSMNFIARSAAQAAYKALEEKYEIISTNKTWLIKINYQFTPAMINYQVKNWTGRPSNKLKANVTNRQLQSPTE